jgi:hypothetical protein
MRLGELERGKVGWESGSGIGGRGQRINKTYSMLLSVSGC